MLPTVDASTPGAPSTSAAAVAPQDQQHQPLKQHQQQHHHLQPQPKPSPPTTPADQAKFRQAVEKLGQQLLQLDEYQETAQYATYSLDKVQQDQQESKQWIDHVHQSVLLRAGQCSFPAWLYLPLLQHQNCSNSGVQQYIDEALYQAKPADQHLERVAQWTVAYMSSTVQDYICQACMQPAINARRLREAQAEVVLTTAADMLRYFQATSDTLSHAAMETATERMHRAAATVTGAKERAQTAMMNCCAWRPALESILLRKSPAEQLASPATEQDVYDAQDVLEVAAEQGHADLDDETFKRILKMVQSTPVANATPAASAVASSSSSSGASSVTTPTGDSSASGAAAGQSSGRGKETAAGSTGRAVAGGGYQLRRRRSH